MKESFEVSVEGFSGPLDLLCHLVESRQMQASRIKITYLVRIYGLYLAKNERASVEAIAEFFFMVAGLLLNKTRSLLPDFTADETEVIEEETSVSEEEFLETLARYRPYRNAMAWLLEKRQREERSFRRILDQDVPLAEEPEYDIGDLYFLARVWWGLFEKHSAKRTALKFEIMEGDEVWDGIPEALPEGSQIERRIEELEGQLATETVLSLRALWETAPSVKLLVVTLLAVLEMCRMGKVSINQEALFSDVEIRAKV